MSKYLKRIGTKSSKFIVEVVLDLLQINLKAPKIQISAILKIGKNEKEIYKKALIKDKQAKFYNQKLQILSTLYLSEKSGYQEKKATIEILLLNDNTQKLAGKISFDIARLINNQTNQRSFFTSLEKCPDKNAKLKFEVRVYPQDQNPDNFNEVSSKSPVKQQKSQITQQKSQMQEQQQQEIQQKSKLQKSKIKNFDEDYEGEEKEEEKMNLNQQFQQQQYRGKQDYQDYSINEKEIEDQEEGEEQEVEEEEQDKVEEYKYMQKQNLENIKKVYNRKQEQQLSDIQERKSDMEVSNPGTQGAISAISEKSKNNKSGLNCANCENLLKKNSNLEAKVEHLEKLIKILQQNSENEKLHLHYQELLEKSDQKLKNLEKEIENYKNDKDFSNLESINQAIKRQSVINHQEHNNNSDLNINSQEYRLMQKKIDILQQEIERKDKDCHMYKMLVDQLKVEKQQTDNKESYIGEPSKYEKLEEKVKDLKEKNHELKKKLKKIELGIDLPEIFSPGLQDSGLKREQEKFEKGIKKKKSNELIEQLRQENNRLLGQLKEIEQKTKQQQYVQFFVQEKETEQKNQELSQTKELLEEYHKSLIDKKIQSEKVNYEKESMQIIINQLQSENKHLYSHIEKLEKDIIWSKEQVGVILNAAMETGDNVICGIIERDMQFREQQEEDEIESTDNNQQDNNNNSEIDEGEIVDYDDGSEAQDQYDINQISIQKNKNNNVVNKDKQQFVSSIEGSNNNNNGSSKYQFLKKDGFSSSIQ